MAEIHQTAIVEKGAVIGENVKIGPYSVIGKDVKIGDGTVIDSHVVITGKTTIGKNNKIYSYASVGQDPQDLKYAGEDTELVIGDNNKIREFVTINKGTLAANKTQIGNNNLLMAYVHVAHDVVLGNNCVLANNVTLAGHVEVSDNVVIGGLTPVHQWVKIGEHAMIGGASAVTQDIAPFVTAEGNRVRVRGLNLTGLKRRGFTDEEISNLKKAYRIIFRSNLPLKDAVDEVVEKFPEDKNLKYMVEFISSCSRGIAR